MAEDHRPPGPNIVDVLIAIHVPQPCSLGPNDDWRLSSNSAKRTYRRIHAAGKEFFGELLKGVRSSGPARHQHEYTSTAHSVLTSSGTYSVLIRGGTRAQQGTHRDSEGAYGRGRFGC